LLAAILYQGKPDNNHKLFNIVFGDFVDRIYPIQLEIKDNTYTDRSAYIFRCIDVVEETGVPMENHRPGASH
jgi:hypothetical protein